MNFIYMKWIELFSTCLASLRDLPFRTVTTIFKTKAEKTTNSIFSGQVVISISSAYANFVNRADC